MRASIIGFVPVCVVLAALAQSSSNSAAPKASDADVRALETKIRQAWEDYKNKNKEAFVRIFTDDAIEVEEGADGAHDVKATLAEMDESNLETYSMSGFYFRPIGSDAMLVGYDVNYKATLAGKAIHNKSIIGEVWEKTAGDWKILYFQETKIK